MSSRHQPSAWRETLEELEQFGVDVIIHRRPGLAAACVRALARVLSWLFRFGVATRHALFRNRIILREHNLGCLVISIGNLTVGGTGKTPVVEMLARALNAQGRKVAILSRGYKSFKPREEKWKRLPLLARLKLRLRGRKPPVDPPRIVSDGESLLLDSRVAGDEPYMLARNLPGVCVVVDKDRVKAGAHAIREFGCDTLLLDDGLQYLRLRHRLDMVLVDSTAPFGTGHLLPRGTMREPRKHLKRASYIFLTKCDGTDQTELIRQLRRYNRVAEIIQCRHRPLHLINAVTGQKKPLSLVEGQYIGTISGIAVPESFENGLRQLGAIVDITRRFTDHHRYTEEEIYGFVEDCEKRDVAMIVTTEKDFVRFPPLPYTDIPVYFLRVEIEILVGHEVWDRCLQRISARSRVAPARVGELAPV